MMKLEIFNQHIRSIINIQRMFGISLKLCQNYSYLTFNVLQLFLYNYIYMTVK